MYLQCTELYKKLRTLNYIHDTNRKQHETEQYVIFNPMKINKLVFAIRQFKCGLFIIFGTEGH